MRTALQLVINQAALPPHHHFHFLSENCSHFHNYLNILHLQNNLHFSGTSDAVRIAGPFATHWFTSNWKTACNSQASATARKLQVILQQPQYLQLIKRDAFHKIDYLKFTSWCRICFIYHPYSIDMNHLTTAWLQPVINRYRTFYIHDRLLSSSHA